MATPAGLWLALKPELLTFELVVDAKERRTGYLSVVFLTSFWGDLSQSLPRFFGY
ncbi:MAG: hypothetical protein V7752_15395 [Halopseudomonas sp.]